MLQVLVVFAVLREGGPQLPAPMETGPAITLRWDAPSSCPDHAEVAAAMAARHPMDAVTVEARVSTAGDEFVAELGIDSPHGSTHRRLQSPSCASIVDAVALLVQVAADPLPTPGRIRVAPAPASVPPTPTLPEPAAFEPPTGAQRPTKPTSRPRPRSRLAATAMVGAGTLPRVDGGARFTFGMATRRVLADIGATILVPQRAPTPADVEVVVGAFAGVARVCPVVPLGRPRLELSACAVLTAGALRGRSSGSSLVGSTRALQPWVRLAAAPELAVVVHPRVRLTATLEGGAHLVRSGFAIAGLGQVWTPRPWAVHGGLGVEVRLP